MKRGRTSVIRGAVLACALLVGGLWWVRSRPGPSLYERGNAAYAAGDWNSALGFARERLRTEPGDREAQRLLARASLRLGKEQPARSIYGALGGTKEMNAEDLYLLGRLLREKGEQDMAVECLSQGLSRDSNHPELLREMTSLDLDADRLEQAAELARRLAGIKGWQSAGDSLLGRVHLAQGDLDGAVSCWRRALEGKPDTQRTPGAGPIDRKLLARALLRLGRPTEARASLQFGKRTETDPETAWLLSRAWLQEGRLAEANQALATGRIYRDEHPLEPEPAPFVGAARCGDCHRARHQDQQRSLHAQTFWRVTDLPETLLPGREVADPQDPRWKYSITRREQQVAFESRHEDRIYRSLVEYAFGSGDRGLTPVARDEKGRSRECRLSRYADGPVWDVTTGQPRRPPAGEDALGRALSDDDLRRCISCHTTNAPETARGVGATVADHGIGCERCHGPGGHHIKAVAAGTEKYADLAIAQPGMGRGPQVVALCGECHSPRGAQKVTRDDPTSVRFQATTLTWSRCYTESHGKFDCMTCHDPHRDAKNSAAYYDAKCLACHGGAALTAAGDAGGDHSKRPASQGSTCPVNPATGCRSCHMPDIIGIVPHSAFADHYIRVRPERREQGAPSPQ
ncbi:MAG: tetratricopeptide repeat protein [Isosphaeraceae bacterium]|nr:tetratricopeptide repeat protein [Isosphaeraceae bacterium]